MHINAQKMTNGFANFFCVLYFQLSEINDKMAEVPLTSDSYMIHTLQRHREILNVIVDFIENI